MFNQSNRDKEIRRKQKKMINLKTINFQYKINNYNRNNLDK